MPTRLALVFTWLVIISLGVPGAAPSPEVQGRVPSDPSAIGYLNLSKRHPDAADGATEFAVSYAPASALQRLEQVRGFLASFKTLTARARGKVPAAEIRSAGNTGADMQSIGFHNIPLILEGTLLKQEYQLRQVEYELAQVRRSVGQVSDEDLERARRAYGEATRRFQEFWDTRRPID